MPDELEFGSKYVIREINEKVNKISDQIYGLAGKAEVAFLSARMDSMVPRSEHEIRWQKDEERYISIKERLDEQDKKHDKMEGKIDTLLANRLPPWFLPFLGVAVGIATVLAAHFWH